jgi:hypothetical protein
VALWREKDLDDMYRMLMREDLASVETQVRGWKALSELFTEQYDKLREYRTGLADRWSSPGGQAYLSKVDQVMASLQAASATFENNAFKLDSARAQIAAGQAALESLIEDFEDGPLTSAWDEYRADEYDKNHSGGFLGVEGVTDWGSAQDPPKREEVLESSGYNSRGKDVMDLLTGQMTTLYEEFQYPETYQGPKDAVKSERMGMPLPPSIGAPTAPGAPGMPGMPGVPTMPAVPPQFQAATAPPTPPTAPNLPPGVPGMLGAPGAPTAPGAPGSPGMPAVPPTMATPGAPVAPGAPGRPAVRPAAVSRPVTPSAPTTPGAPATPGKPGVPGRMAPPPSAMGPRGGKKAAIPPRRPGTPLGPPSSPGKPGAPGRMAPPPSAMGPKATKKGAVPARPNRPGTPPDPGSNPGRGDQGRMGPPPAGGPGKGGRSSRSGGRPGNIPEQGYGGKPGAGTPGKPGTGSGGPRGQFQPPPHIGAPRTSRKPKQSGYGKFGPPDGTPGTSGAPRVTRPGGSRPVLSNKNAVPLPGSVTPRGTGVPSSLKPPAKPPKAKSDTRGVIRPSGKDPLAEVSPLKRNDKRRSERLKDPLTRRYLDEFRKVAGLAPLTPLAPPAAPRRHTPGPAIGF